MRVGHSPASQVRAALQTHHFCASPVTISGLSRPTPAIPALLFFTSPTTFDMRRLISTSSFAGIINAAATPTSNLYLSETNSSPGRQALHRMMSRPTLPGRCPRSGAGPPRAQAGNDHRQGAGTRRLRADVDVLIGESASGWTA